MRTRKNRVDDIFPARLAAVRGAAGLPQAALAERVGCSTEFVSRMERGKALPSLTTLMRLCDVLRCTPDDLLLVQDLRGRTGAARLAKSLSVADPELRDRATWVAEAVLAYEAVRPLLKRRDKTP